AFLVNYHEWPDANAKMMGFDPEREAYQRIFLIRKLREYGIHVDTDVALDVAQGMMNSFNRQGGKVPIDDFVAKILQPRATALDFERFVRHQVGIQQLRALVGLGGELVQPQEAQSAYIHEHQQLATEAVFFNASNFLASVSAPDAQ